MKLICDCGEESEFVIHPLEEGEEIDEENGSYARLTGKIDIIAEHEHAWVICNKCNNKMWIFT